MTNHVDITRQLDRLEQNLPSIPSKAVRLGRATMHRITDVASSVADRVSGGVDRTGAVAADAASTTVGQARSGVARTATRAQRSAKETLGQGRAQTARTIDAVENEVAAALDDATAAVEPTDLDGLTKAELYEQAQELDIEGRSDMTKAELRAAVAARSVSV